MFLPPVGVSGGEATYSDDVTRYEVLSPSEQLRRGLAPFLALINGSPDALPAEPVFGHSAEKFLPVPFSCERIRTTLLVPIHPPLGNTPFNTDVPLPPTGPRDAVPGRLDRQVLGFDH